MSAGHPLDSGPSASPFHDPSIRSLDQHPADVQNFGHRNLAYGSGVLRSLETKGSDVLVCIFPT